MSTSSNRMPGRFVPTLTQVVDPESLGAPPPPIEAKEMPPATPSVDPEFEDVMVRRVIAQLQRKGDDSLAAWVDRELQAQAKEILRRMQPEIERQVRQSVARELSQLIDPSVSEVSSDNSQK